MPRFQPSRCVPLLCSALCATPALASESPASDTADSHSGVVAPRKVSTMAGAGAFLAWTEQARTDTHRAVASLHSGHATRAGWSHSGSGELVVLGPGSVLDSADEIDGGGGIGVALRGGVFSRRGEQASGEIGLKAQLTSQHRTGFDLAATLLYQNEGFNLRPALASGIQCGTSIGSWLLLGNVGYGQGLADEERYGTLKLAVLRQVSEQLHAGVDSMLDLDLELDADEPDGEPQLLLQAGPAVTWTIGSVALSAQVGLSVLQPRFEAARAGGVAVIGAGGGF